MRPGRVVRYGLMFWFGWKRLPPVPEGGNRHRLRRWRTTSPSRRRGGQAAGRSGGPGRDRGARDLAEAPLDLRGVQILEQQLVGLDLSDRNGEGVQLVECRAENVDLSGAALHRASMRGPRRGRRQLGQRRRHGGEAAAGRATERPVDGSDPRRRVFARCVVRDCRMDLAAMRFGRLERVRFKLRSLRCAPLALGGA